MSGEFLFEIGTEEIPSGDLDTGLMEMRRLAESFLTENRIGIGEGLEACGTPRRLVLIGRGLAEKQADTVQEITGPPKKAAFDEAGNPTKAAVGFAKKQGISVDELEFLDTPKGEYLYLKKRIPGRPTPDVLSEILPRLMADIPWPKSMRWGNVGFSFSRPVHWVLALFDGRVIPFEAAGVASGNATQGHRFMAPHTLEIRNLDDYLSKMAENRVMIDPKGRMAVVEEIVAGAAEKVGGVPMKDPELLSTVTNLVEYPSAVCGGFDKAFL